MAPIRAREILVTTIRETMVVLELRCGHEAACHIEERTVLVFLCNVPERIQHVNGYGQISILEDHEA